MPFFDKQYPVPPPTLSQLLFDGLRDPTRGVALDRQGALDEVDDVMARALGKASQPTHPPVASAP